jgi:hypothetical protein
MRLAIALFAAALFTGAMGLPATGHAASMEIRDAVARVTVIPESRADVKVEVIAANPRLPITIRVRGDRTTIDGGLGRRIRQCRGRSSSAAVQVAGLGEVAYRDLPQIVIRAPRDVNLAVSGAVYGVVGRTASLDLVNGGCGDWTLGDVAGDLRISQAGSGDTHMGKAGRAKIRVAGSGAVNAAQIRQGLVVDIAGSGGVAATWVSGPLDVRVAGSGDVTVSDGRVGPMTVAVAGSGKVTLGGVADSLKARITGAGDVRVRQVRGSVAKVVLGSGSILVGPAPADRPGASPRTALDRRVSSR